MRDISGDMTFLNKILLLLKSKFIENQSFLPINMG